MISSTRAVTNGPAPSGLPSVIRYRVSVDSRNRRMLKSSAMLNGYPGPGVQASRIAGEASGDSDDAHPSCPELLIEFPHLVAVSTLARCAGRP